MAKSFDSLVKRTTNKKTRDRAARRTQELVAKMLLAAKRTPSRSSKIEVRPA
ncbi:MAG TPA: hypothetical protein VGN42_03555 [Pirellulales bacterium]|nr:hypothetical protein [Pirellulales bacterium]